MVWLSFWPLPNIKLKFSENYLLCLTAGDVELFLTVFITQHLLTLNFVRTPCCWLWLIASSVWWAPSRVLDLPVVLHHGNTIIPFFWSVCWWKWLIAYKTWLKKYINVIANLSYSALNNMVVFISQVNEYDILFYMAIDVVEIVSVM